MTQYDDVEPKSVHRTLIPYLTKLTKDEWRTTMEKELKGAKQLSLGLC